ncbi:hypothetical protein [Mycobacterium avium]|uniref:hypothetical protein n=1 Tax=Mycobacterium avium TaxID=1764 RepID=UPI00111BFB98|nr:hypothetical protein [Mycobacterium avium]
MDNFKFKINKAGMEQLQRDMEEKFAGGVRVPLDGSEENAVRSVIEQLQSMGVTPNDANVREIVRQARNG